MALASARVGIFHTRASAGGVNDSSGPVFGATARADLLGDEYGVTVLCGRNGKERVLGTANTRVSMVDNRQ